MGKYKRQRVRKSEDAAGAGNGDMTVAGDVDIEEYADADADMDGGDDSIIAIGADGDGTSISPGMPTHTLQRLGHWDCRLCRSRKYLEAGQNRVPSAPVSDILPPFFSPPCYDVIISLQLPSPLLFGTAMEVDFVKIDSG